MQAGGAGQSIPVCKVNVIRCQKNDSVSKESKDHHPPDNYKSIPGRALARNPSDCRPQHSSDGGWNAGDKQLDPLQCWNRFVVTVVVYDGCCVVAESPVQSYIQLWPVPAGRCCWTRRIFGGRDNKTNARSEIRDTQHSEPTPLLQQARHPGSALSPPSHRCTAQCQITGGHRNTSREWRTKTRTKLPWFCRENFLKLAVWV